MSINPLIMKNTLLLAFLFLFGTVYGQTPSAAYTFHSGAYLDFSGLGNDLTATGDVMPAADVDGVANQAVSLTNGNLSAGDANLNMDGPITVSVWIRIDEIVDWTAIVNKWQAAAGSYYMGINPDNRSVRWNCNVANVEDNMPVPIDTWTHFAGSYDGNEIKLFRDGVLINTTTGANAFGTNAVPMMIGAQSNGPINNYIGDIDNVLIFKTALTDQEVFEVYQNGFALRNKDLGLTALDMDRVQISPAPITLNSAVFNLGMETINSFDLKWSDGTDEGSKSFTGLNIETGVFYDLDEASNLNLETGEELGLDVWIENINGSSDDSELNNSQFTDIRGFSFLPERKMVIEEGTGTWCGWCPRGAVALDQISIDFPDEVIGIAVHNGDPMVVPEYDDAVGFSGYPSCHVDRTILNTGIGPGAVENYYIDRIANIDNTPEATVAHATIVSNGTSSLQVDIETTIAFPLEGDYRFMVVLTEDGVTGTTPDFAQANYYSGGGVGPMGGYENLPDPVPASDMVYNHVARGIFGTYDGEAGSLPNVLEIGETYTHTFNIDNLDTLGIDDPSKLHVITMMLDSESGRIINATSSGFLEGTVSIEDLPIIEDIKLYPNPSQGASMLKIDLDQKTDVSIQILDLNGRLMTSKSYGSQNGSMIYPILPEADWNGLYLIQIELDNQLITKKWIIE